jgi:NAD(P)-dependent dehydrogenase (short-subunit alcohol dehydrogenase family)
VEGPCCLNMCMTSYPIFAGSRQHCLTENNEQHCVQALDVSAAALQCLVEELNMPQRLLTIACDVCDDASQAAAFERHIYRWGGVDVAILNAGIGESGE